MAKGYQARAMQSALRLLGEGAFLRGAACGNVSIERNVALSPGIGDTADDNFMATYTVATLENAYAPRVGDLLVHPEGQFRLDRLVQNNGIASRFIVAVVP